MDLVFARRPGTFCARAGSCYSPHGCFYFTKSLAVHAFTAAIRLQGWRLACHQTTSHRPEKSGSASRGDFAKSHCMRESAHFLRFRSHDNLPLSTPFEPLDALTVSGLQPCGSTALYPAKELASWAENLFLGAVLRGISYTSSGLETGFRAGERPGKEPRFFRVPLPSLPIFPPAASGKELGHHDVRPMNFAEPQLLLRKSELREL